MTTRTARAVLALALLTAACGGAGTTTSTTAAVATSTTEAASAFPVTIDTAAGPVTIEAMPQRIVSLSATATETLFAIRAGDQVVAADDTSNYPPQAPTTDLNGFTVTAESVAALEPDLVVFFFEPGDLGEGLAVLGIPAIWHPAANTVDDVATQIEQIGVATGHVAEAAVLVAEIETQLAAITAAVDEAATPPSSYYYELDQTYFSLTSTTFVGTLLSTLGLTSIADPADEEGFGYPQLSAEFIVEADPDLILLADTKCCGQDAQTVAERPGWSALSAVERGAIVLLDDDVASRWGPRIVDLVDQVADVLLSLETAGS
jgi:iron complex transport system substrate-binding protein